MTRAGNISAIITKHPVKKMPPKLRFDERRIPDLASKYEHWLAEQARVLALEMSLLNRREQVRSRGYLEKTVAAVLCPALFRMFLTYWKLFTVANAR